jgi:hypothetical protein
MYAKNYPGGAFHETAGNSIESGKATLSHQPEKSTL